MDEEFKNASKWLIDKFKQGKMTAIISDLTRLELKKAPREVKNIFKEIPEDNIEYVELTEEEVYLARKYIYEGVIAESKLVDVEHIAIATVNRVDVLVSWDFQHIVNLNKIHGYNSVNLKYGYPLLEIRSPMEVLTYEEEKEI